jgi:hypothetical protein
MTAAGLDDHIDELIEAGPFSHGAAQSEHAMWGNTCNFRVCQDWRINLGIPMNNKDGRPFPLFMDFWGCISGCRCQRCT